jgi:hypothetical protein
MSSSSVPPSNSLELRLIATSGAGTLQAPSPSHPIKHPPQPRATEPQPSEVDTAQSSNQIQERSELPQEVDAALSSNPDRVVETGPSDSAQGVDAAPMPQSDDPRNSRIVNRTHLATIWSHRTFGADDGLHEYMKQLDQSDAIFSYCEELRRLCGAYKHRLPS